MSLFLFAHPTPSVVSSAHCAHAQSHNHTEIYTKGTLPWLMTCPVHPPPPLPYSLFAPFDFRYLYGRFLAKLPSNHGHMPSIYQANNSSPQAPTLGSLHQSWPLHSRQHRSSHTSVSLDLGDYLTNQGYRYSS